MLLDFKKLFDINKGKTYLAKLIKEGAKAELTKKNPKRTLSQNSYIHALYCMYGIEFGYDAQYVKQIVFKIEVNKRLFKREYVDKETGEITGYLRSTADLDTGELTLAIERFRNYSSQNGLYLMTGDEYIQNHFYIKQQIEQHKEYL